MAISQPIIVNDQQYAAASVSLNVLIDLSYIGQVISVRAALYSDTTGALISVFDECYAQIESNAIYKNGTATTQFGAYNTYKSKINSSPNDFLTLLSDVPIRPGGQTIGYYVGGV